MWATFGSHRVYSVYTYTAAAPVIYVHFCTNSYKLLPACKNGHFWGEDWLSFCRGCHHSCTGVLAGGGKKYIRINWLWPGLIGSHDRIKQTYCLYWIFLVVLAISGCGDGCWTELILNCNWTSTLNFADGIKHAPTNSSLFLALVSSFWLLASSLTGLCTTEGN